MAATIVGALVLDLAIPSYPIAGFYLVPVTLAALTLRVRDDDRASPWSVSGSAST